MRSVPHDDSRPRSAQAVGLAYTLSAFLLWGLAPVFWKALGQVPAPELLAHRVGWSGVLLVGLLAWQGRWDSLRRILTRRATMVPLVGTTGLIAGNWLLFIWAINSGHVLEASLGYFINPLINVVLGLVVLGERLRRWQMVSVGLAAIGVLYLTWRLAQVPWISLGLAFSFGFYALLRKQTAAPPEEGLAVETWLLTPLMLLYLGRLEIAGQGTFGHVDLTTHVLLVLTGAITATPLVWFHHGAKRLTLSTVGILQYLTPTGHFVLAVAVYGEPFARPHLVAFVLIWAALVVFSVDLWRAGRGSPPSPGPQ